MVRRQPLTALKLAQPVSRHRRRRLHLRAARPHLRRQAVVRPTPNPNFRRVDARMLDDDGRQILLLSTILGRHDEHVAAPLPRLHADRGAGRDGRDGDHVAHGLARRRRHRPHARSRTRCGSSRTLRLETVIAQWEQDLASMQETSAVPTLSCDGQSVRLTRRTEGGLQVVVWSLRPGPRRLRLAALGRPGGDDDAQPAGQLAAHAAVPGQRDRPAARAHRPRGVAGLLLPGQRLGQLPVDRRRRPPLPTAPRTLCPAAPLVLGFAPDSGLLPTGVRVVLGFAPRQRPRRQPRSRDTIDRAMTRALRRIDSRCRQRGAACSPR